MAVLLENTCFLKHHRHESSKDDIEILDSYSSVYEDVVL
jgi:hypothetical protein